jgi:hypothetical protein
MSYRYRLLEFSFTRHEAQRWLGQSIAASLRISRIGLSMPDKGLDVE